MTTPDLGTDLLSDEPEMATAEQLVRCDGVTHEYRRPTRSGRRWWRRTDEPSAPSVSALTDVSLTVRRGETVGITGPTGSGKSTLLHLIAGLLVPTAGRVELLGTDLSTLSAGARATVRHRHLGLVFQRFYLLPSLSARANVALPLVQTGLSRARRRERATALLDRVGLGDRATHRPGTLSGGERQRVAIARALVTDPDVILADEPTGELDTATGRQVLDLLTDIADDPAVVVASHDETALDIADRVRYLHDGRFIGSAHDLDADG